MMHRVSEGYQATLIEYVDPKEPETIQSGKDIRSQQVMDNHGLSRAISADVWLRF